MPMSFPDMASLKQAAEIHGFRPPNESESEDGYRSELADFVRSIDLVESQEIRTGKGWDRFDAVDNLALLLQATIR